jgi:hypothetical protein
MSDNAQTVDNSQAGDIERGNHEPWSHRDAPQGSAPATPSSQTSVDATPPQSAVETSKEAKEIAEVKETKPEAQPTPPEAQQAKQEVQQAQQEVQQAKPAPPPARPKPPKKKYSKWVIFRLYFNTYRYESFPSFSEKQAITERLLQKIFRICRDFQPHGPNHLGGRAFPICPSVCWYHCSGKSQFRCADAQRNLRSMSVSIFQHFFRKGMLSFFLKISVIYNMINRKWPPLWFRLGITSSLQHLGGIHSGCGVSAVGWLTYRVYNIYNERHYFHPAVLATGLTTLVFLCITALAAFPWVRNTHHK